MERADLLYSGLMFAAGMLSVWTALLLTATFVVLAPSLRKSASRAATISSIGSRSSGERSEQHSKERSARRPIHHGAEEPTPPRSVSEALPQRSGLGRALRLIQ
jgi:hypothetical protein